MMAVAHSEKMGGGGVASQSMPSCSDSLNELQRQEKDDPSRSAFASPDILLNILLPLVDGDVFPAICNLSLVSKAFHHATLSNEFWKRMCYQRWMRKWGFHPRWERALLDYSRCMQQKQSGSNSGYWRSRYLFEEQDARRGLLMARELSSMVFDFRFWVGRPTVVDGRIIVRSGLLTSASRDVRFALAKERSLEDRREVDNATPTWSARGNVTGHPCNDPGIECKSVALHVSLPTRKVRQMITH